MPEVVRGARGRSPSSRAERRGRSGGRRSRAAWRSPSSSRSRLVASRGARSRCSMADHVGDLVRGTRGRCGSAVDPLDRHARPRSASATAKIRRSVGSRQRAGRGRRSLPALVEHEAVGAGVEHPHRLLQRLLEARGRWPSPRPPTSWPSRCRRRRPGNLLEVPARHLHHHVVERRLEAGAGRAGDRVRDLGQRLCRARAWRRRRPAGSRWPWRPAPRSATGGR